MVEPEHRRAILVVDDDPDVCRMFAIALGPLGDVVVADGGAAGLALVRGRRFDAIVLDLHMPHVDGFVVLAELAKNENPNRRTPVYVASADTSEDARVEALRSRAVFFLGKPVSLKMMTATIGNQIARAPTKKAAG